MESSDRLARWSLVISVASALFAGYGLWLGQKTYDRAAGKITASLSLVKVEPSLEQLGPEFIDPNAEGFGPLVRFNTLDEFVANSPRLTVENTSNEPIDAIRVSVRFLGGIIDSTGAPAAVQQTRNPMVLQQTNHEDYLVTLPPGRKAVIPFPRELLGQMLQARNPKQGDRVHFGIFMIRCSASLVGMEQFDFMEDSGAVLRFAWVPSGFSEQNVRDFIAEFKPTIDPLK